ncbi:hypothetical protein BLNAU_23868 [Blattamonas nauphoetae]|uniref:mitogen-activated protein kinase kinase n=1 Tax=Blattamonas nauphoetae TaxID=2049346 RepID=A0ABQ9WP15_9EUKA|nr:hypothetical protein BLNAU_23868 [Blattamonas nauphoetae]
MLFSKPNIRDAFDVRSGRALHLAPELMDEPDLYRATPQSDVWAFGILLLESVLGLNPFSSMEGDRLRDGVRGLKLDVFFESLSSKHSKRASPNFRSLVKECLKQNPSERITFKSMKERQLIRSLLSSPEDIAAFDATIARHYEHRRNSGEEWRPFGRLEVDVVGVGMRYSVLLMEGYRMIDLNHFVSSIEKLNGEEKRFSSLQCRLCKLWCRHSQTNRNDGDYRLPEHEHPVDHFVEVLSALLSFLPHDSQTEILWICQGISCAPFPAFVEAILKQKIIIVIVDMNITVNNVMTRLVCEICVNLVKLSDPTYQEEIYNQMFEENVREFWRISHIEDEDIVQMRKLLEEWLARVTDRENILEALASKFIS